MFADLVFAGHKFCDAYRKAYNRPDLPMKSASERGSRIAASREIQEYMAEVRRNRSRHVLLSLDERLKILAEIGTDKSAKKGDRVAALKEYARQSGDMPVQPAQEIHISAPDGGPVQHEVSGQVEITVQERIAQLITANGGPVPESIAAYLQASRS